MLNAEKNKKVILDLTEGGYYFAVRKDGQNIARSCDGLNCEDCIFDEEEDCGCSFSRMKWMLSEYKEPIKVNKLEYDILKHILNHTEYRYIVRSFNNVYVYTHEPINDLVGGIWCVGEGTYEKVSPLKDLFQFIQWEDEEPTSIEEVLNSCEVVNDAEE